MYSSRALRSSWLQNSLIDWRSASVSDRNSKPCPRSIWLRTSAKTLSGVDWPGTANSKCTMLPTEIGSGRVAPSPASAKTKQCPTWARCWRSRTRTGKLVRYRGKRRQFAYSCCSPVWARSKTLVDVNAVFIVANHNKADSTPDDVTWITIAVTKVTKLKLLIGNMKALSSKWRKAIGSHGELHFYVDAF